MCLSSSLLKSCEAIRKSESVFSDDKSVTASAMVRYNKNNADYSGSIYSQIVVLKKDFRLIRKVKIS